MAHASDLLANKEIIYAIFAHSDRNYEGCISNMSVHCMINELHPLASPE